MQNAKQREDSQEKKFYTGFSTLEIRAINPTRKELNKLLGKDDGDEDKEITYIDTDRDGNDRVRLTFWAYDSKVNKFFVYSTNLTNKERTSNDGIKNQYINSVALTGWADSESNLKENFTHFLDKDKSPIAKKQYRKALFGEEELGRLMRSWLGKWDFQDTKGSTLVNTASLLKGDYSELRALIDSAYDTPFVALLGVKTDPDDSTKQYQQIWKSFLPNGFMKYIEKNKFPTDYTKKTWDYFVKEVEGGEDGKYAFPAFYKLEPLSEYNKDEDISASDVTKKEEVTAVNSNY